MNSIAQTTASSIAAPTQFIECGSRTLAYRSTGSGTPMILCNRFRGILSTWDPAFIDALAQNFRVITFDYSGIGQSSGDPPTTLREMAQDAHDLADALGLEQIVIAGWSIGGVVAQTFLAQYPERVSHAVVIGTNPPGEKSHAPEQLFFDIALKPLNDLADEKVLFFEPASNSSRDAAEASHARIVSRTTDQDVPVPPEVFIPLLQAIGADITADTRGVLDVLKTTSKPILVISGDHDISAPVENWYNLSRELPTAQHIVFPHTGHGPQHQHPKVCAQYITTFIQMM